jgi:hypothetical protein
LRYPYKMTPEYTTPREDKKIQILEEICENTRAIRRTTNRMLDYMHEYQTKVHDPPEPDEWTWEDLSDNDDPSS